MVLIGGYAIAAYGGARYSDDIDFVLPESARSRFVRWTTAQGFAVRQSQTRYVRMPFGNAIRLERGPITLDLLVGFVRDREAQVDVPSHWVALRSRKIRLDLLTGKVQTAAQVARPEAIWALKLQAGRDQDITDLFAIMSEPVRSQQVLELFQNLMTRNLGARLAGVSARLADRKLCDDARSRLGLKDSGAVRLRWERFSEITKRMIPHGVAPGADGSPGDTGE